MVVSVFGPTSYSGRKALPFWLTGMFALLCSTAFAQEVHVRPNATPATTQAPDGLSLHMAPLRVNVNLVLVPVTVTDSMNRPVLGLTKDDFTLLEGEAARDIRYFSAEDAPLSIGVLLDISRSMTDKIDLARTALAEFFDNANPADDYFVMTFSDRPDLLADSTTSVGTIREKLADVKPAGHTALLDAIYMGMQKLRSARYRRRALLVISDGGDNHSRFTSGELKNMVMEGDVQIYGIGIYSRIFHSPEEWSGKRLLTQITEATGGHTITVNNPRELPDAAASISTELRNQYVLGYQPEEGQAAGWRKIKVHVTPRDKAAPLQLYWRKGYMGAGQ